MSAPPIHFIEFRGRDGALVLQRVDGIETVLETKTKAGTELYLLLRNGNKFAVVGESIDSLKRRMRDAAGVPLHVQPLDIIEGQASEVAPAEAKA